MDFKGIECMEVGCQECIDLYYCFWNMFCAESKISTCKVPNVSKNWLGKWIKLVSWLETLLLTTTQFRCKNGFLMFFSSDKSMWQCICGIFLTLMPPKWKCENLKLKCPFLCVFMKCMEIENSSYVCMMLWQWPVIYMQRKKQLNNPIERSK